MKLDFVRGHMGGNRIILLRGDQLPPGRELEIAVKLMEPNYLHAHEAGIVYEREEQGHIEVKIAEPSLPCFISACGGFTQVLGAALIETALGELFGINKRDPLVDVMLHTDCGPTALAIETLSGKALRIKTDMGCFVRECYERGVEKLNLSSVQVMRSGKFLVVNTDLFKAAHPQADFSSWDMRTRDALFAMQSQFQQKTGEIEPNVTLYDWRPEQGGDLRVVFPHQAKDDFIEPSCGTGSVALGIALLASGELNRLLPAGKGLLTLNLESGGGLELGGPEVTVLEMEVNDHQVQSMAFSHSLVQITAVGEARI